MRIQHALWGVALMISTTVGAAFAADRAPINDNAAGTTGDMIWKMSDVRGMEVRNAANDKVGTVEDLVFDGRTGTLRYAALGVGGFLGIDERMFAVPWNAFQVKNDNGKHFLLLNVEKEKLKNAPGFDKKHWPDMANPNFGKEIDAYYGARTAAKPIAK